jgi:gamma-glutamylcysteine synthetase
MHIFTYLEFNLIHVNLDFSSEKDMIKKFRAGLAL